MRLSGSLAMIAVLCGGLTACPHDHVPVGPDDPPVAGTYLMRTIDGAAVPVTVPSELEGHARQITGGSITLDADGTCVIATSYLDSRDGSPWTPTMAEFACTYTASLPTLQINQSGLHHYPATLILGRLVVVSGGAQVAYTR